MSKTEWYTGLDKIDAAQVSDDQLGALAESVGRILLANGLIVSTAESCTGGLVAKLITDVAGSSTWFDAGYVTYSNSAKHRMLGVPETLIEREGAVCKGVVTELAQGAIDRSEAEISTAISGIAGPGGGSAEKPVGTVWIAWASERQLDYAIRYQFEGNRDAIRRQAAVQALKGILQLATAPD